MSSNQIRQQFLDFFASKGHQIVPSAPIVVKNDPTLMFTNAGMNQFKDLFLGNEAVKYARVADTQKCLRVSGKHNDLEEVGVDTYHHTMFEMLGNWSFGDYFKTEAIEWAWELLTKVYGLPEDRLYVTVFEGDDSENLAFDGDAKDEWKKWIAEERILNGNKKDNFWEMGETGPCGPCSEIHIDLRTDEERKQVSGASLVNNDHPQVIEVWNLVFMEFNRMADGSLKPLPNKHVDTGMGFERLCRAIEGKSSNYDTDVFTGMIERIGLERSNNQKFYSRLSQDDPLAVACRVIVDHIRTVTFAIVDGQIPSNDGAGYVIRRILRRAIRYSYSVLNMNHSWMYHLVDDIAYKFKGIFPEVNDKKSFVKDIIKSEEENFLRTIKKGLDLINELTHGYYGGKKIDLDPEYRDQYHNKKILKGSYAFELKDTHGFPLDLTALVLSTNGWTIDEGAYNLLLEEQKNRSRKASTQETGDWNVIKESEATNFIGYDFMEAEVHITRMRSVKFKNKDLIQLVFDQTPFYAESGGQVGDTGVIQSANEKIHIIDTQKENNLIIHIADKFPENPEAVFYAKVNATKRVDTENNHSATHLMHAALREVLGTHVEQKGSLVNAEHLRFDFSHFKGMSKEETRQVEQRVNEKIRANIALDERRAVPIAEAKTMGAMALFGEKYGEEVRVITFDPAYSRELCGGTHVTATGQIGSFKILSESAVAAGVRRIEAITGKEAEHWAEELDDQVGALKDVLKSKDLVKSVEKLLAEKLELEKKLDQLEGEKTQQIKSELIAQAASLYGEIRDYYLIIERIVIPNAEQLKNLSYQLKNEIPNLVCVLGAVIDGKPLLSIIIDEALVKSKGLHAGNMIKELAKEIKGGGGGQPFYATAGGSDVNGLDAALAKAKTLV